MSVDLTEFKKKLARVSGERLNAIRKETAQEAAVLLGAYATMDMPIGGKGKNMTMYLRVRTQRLLRSYTVKNDAYHVENISLLSDGVTRLTFGSRATSDRGFPYALAHEKGGKHYPARPHLARALQKFRQESKPREYARKMAEEIIKAINAG